VFSSPGCVVTNVSYYNGARGSGDGRVQVTNNNKDDNFPSYSPDGKKIAYTGCKGNDHGGDIYTINVGGGGKFRVTHNNADEAAPSWGGVRSGFSSGRRGRPRVEV
jgi:Tol biopolymer transport system component